MRWATFVVVVLAWGLPTRGEIDVGFGRADITPDGPIRLCGYAVREKESEGVAQRIYARAIAIGSDQQGVCVLVTVDSTAIPAALTEEIAGRLREMSGVARERLVIGVTHSHATPWLSGSIPNMFGRPVPPEHIERVAQYTKQYAQGIEKAALAAIADRKPAKLEWAQGKAAFAANRRGKPIAPVDHAMPVLIARDAEGKVRGVVINYACHCTTLGGEWNQIHGDWAGCASEFVEAANPGAVALVTIGAGADANPQPRGKLEHAQQHGRGVADEVARLLKEKARELATPPAGKLKRIELAWDKLPSREEWEKIAQRKDAVGFNARHQLARMEKGARYDQPLRYTVQTWTFGEDLAMVFLAGEVVVDFTLRLKQEFQADKLWVTAYANDVPCYIPSRRILEEGGYEAEGAMTYYGMPGRLAPAVENDIVRTVHELLPPAMRSKESLNEFPLPRNVDDAVKALRVRDDLEVDVAAAEPLLVSPIAIDWGVDGKLWVVEMYDYPTGLHENWTPGGRIKCLTDADGDGRYDKASVFLDGLSFPQGVMAWRGGVLVCAAPDVLYAEDTDGDGRADVRKVLFSGFPGDNQQWAVNGLAWGLDGWVYGASSIGSNVVKVAGTDRVIPLGGRDFRMNPDALAFEPAAGRTQFCRVRDDWGNWFGNDNSHPLWHYPMAEHYVRRNPDVTPPGTSVLVMSGAGFNQIYPASRTLERFNAPKSANRTTSACGPAIYRDRLMGAEFYGNAFYCEPVHNVVQRLVLERGATFVGKRAKGEEKSEFLASTDNWFRPVQVRTGPDGALWVVDMYRFVVEHPRWITPQRLARLDVRAGAEMGRIYRVYAKGSKPRPLGDLSRLSTQELAKRMEDGNGTVRDLVHRELLHRADKSAGSVLEEIAGKSENPAARVQAMHALEGLGALEPTVLESALSHSDARVRRNALALAEGKLKGAAAKAVADPDPGVRFQAALSLGADSDPAAGDALVRLAASDGADPWMRAAALNSSAGAPVQVLEGIAAALEKLEGVPLATRLAAIGDVLEMMERRGILPGQSAMFRRMSLEARSVALDGRAAVDARVAALRLMGRDAADLEALRPLLRTSVPHKVQVAALSAIGRTAAVEVPAAVGDAWKELTPALRGHAAEMLVGRPVWGEALLALIEEGNVGAGELPPGVRDRLLKAGVERVRKKAERVLGASRTTERLKVVEALRPALKLTGNPSAGAGVFEKLCASCHALGGVGHAVGRDLAALVDRSGESLLTHILDPNRAVDGKYVSYQVDTADGRTLAGMVADESAAGFTIVQGNGVRDVIQRAAVKRLRSTGVSMMPEGLEEGLRPQDLADLISHVQKSGPAK